MKSQYKVANKAEKSELLDQACQTLSMHRKSVIRLFNRTTKAKRKRPGRKKQYDSPELIKVLKDIWLISDQISGCLGAHNRFWDFQVSQNRIASLGGLFFWAARLPLKQAATKTTYSSSPPCSCMPLRRENIASSTDLLWRLRHVARWE